MHYSKFTAVILLAASVGCQFLPWGQEKAKTIFVGEPETIMVEPPEDAMDLTFRWNIEDLPDESLLVPDFSSTSNLFTFAADVIGIYTFSVVVESEGVELDEHIVSYEAVEDTSIIPAADQVPQAAEIPEEPSAQEQAADQVRMAMSKIAAPALAPVTPITTQKPAVAKKKTRPAAKRKAPAKSSIRSMGGEAVSGHYTIQVSSWTTAKQAQDALDELTSKGFDAYIQRVVLADKNETWWRVRMGEFTEIAEAKDALAEVAKNYRGAWVDYVRKEDFE